jgi:hypothetical protein
MLKLLLKNLNILLNPLIMIEVLLVNLNILLKSAHYDRSFISKFKYFIKIHSL